MFSSWLSLPETIGELKEPFFFFFVLLFHRSVSSKPNKCQTDPFFFVMLIFLLLEYYHFPIVGLIKTFLSYLMGTKSGHYERCLLRVCTNYPSVTFTNGSWSGNDKLYSKLRARCRCMHVYICERAYWAARRASSSGSAATTKQLISSWL